MSLVSPSQSNPNDEVTAAAINNPVNQLAAVINGNIDATNITDSSVSTAKVADSGITPAKLQSGTGSTWAWSSWTPTYTNITVGNGTVTAKYKQTGKTVTARFHLDIGSTTAVGDGIVISLPVAAHADYTNFRYAPIGTALAHDAGTAIFAGHVYIDQSTVNMTIRWEANSANLSTSGNFVFVEANGDDLSVSITYEAA